MLPSLTLPLLGLLLALPGIPGFPGLKAFRRQPPAPVDSLPPAWKTPSRLALENQFVLGDLPGRPDEQRLRLTGDPRQLRVGLDPESGEFRARPEFGEVAVGSPTRVPLAQFGADLSRRNYARFWAERSRSHLNSIGAGGGVPADRPGISLVLPVAFPSRLRSILGPGSPALNVSGTESIKLSGQSDWTNQQVVQLGQRRSLFPSLDMQQDLDIRLEGQLSDRIKVNLLQNSAVQIPLANRIAINYKGDEDDLVQALDLGNTNLSLPNTQYVSYSGRNEGLFGMKASSRFGPLDFTVLASKQEGKSERSSYAGGSARQTPSLADFDYVKDGYFFFYDPNVTDPPQLIIDPTVRLYLDEGFTSTQVDFVRGRAFVDPINAQLDSSSVTPTPSVRGNFKLLNPGADQDYEILHNVYDARFKVIRLKRPITGELPRLAVTYQYFAVNAIGQPVGDTLTMGGADEIDTDGQPSRTMKLLRVPRSLLPEDEVGNYDLTAPFAPTLELELKNFYNLQGQRIDPRSFKLAIRKGVEVPHRTSIQKGNETVPYFELLGLDNFTEQNGFPERGHDSVIDGTGPISTSRMFVDYENGTLFLPDPRPFAPRIGGPQGTKPFDQFVSTGLFGLLRRDSLVGSTPETTPNVKIYDKRVVIRQTDVEYYIDLDFTAAQAGGEIHLGRSNIIEGSDAVIVSGQTWVRDRDYRIDYDLGRVTLIRQLGPGDQVNVDYSYAPLFQQAGRTLLGSAFRAEGRDKHFGGAFLYESKGAQDLRPRLGEEPSRVVIGDLNSEWRFRPEWITRLVDRLPGVRTTAPSDFNLSAEMGLSVPNPNTRNEVYIDDMEGVRDAVSLGMDPLRWRLTSIPQRMVSGFPQPIENFEKNVELRWYSPLNAVKERDLKPSLSNAQGAQNTRQVLALSIPRRPTAFPDPAQPLWAGLTYVLDPVGLDLSKAQFIDLWISDFRDHHEPNTALPTPRVRGFDVKLHIDLGVVSENQMRAPNVLPNNALDSEDKVPRDNQLTVTSGRNEDTGLDGKVNVDEAPSPRPDLTTSNDSDPEGDDFAQPLSGLNDIDPRKWDRVNGTEGNKNVLPVIDTEDLNLNNNLDAQQDYFEYTIDLGDTSSTHPYLVTEVFNDFARYENDGQPLPLDNGWRRYRIPIADSVRVKFGSPDLTLARHVRVWLEDIREPNGPQGGPENEQRPFVLLGAIDIAGSRWLASEIDTVAREAGTTLTLNSVNTIDNAEDYVPPFDPGRTVSGSQELVRREQSLALEFTNLGPGTELEAFKTFSLDENYSRYGNMRFYVAGFDIRDAYNPIVDSLFYFVRFSSDEQGRNYYEYRSRLRSSSSRGAIDWQDIELALTDLSNLKLNDDFPRADPIFYVAPGRTPDEQFIINGRPSFTRLRRISFGIVNDSTSARTYSSGQFWLNELRATDVAKDVGRAQRFNINGRLSNLLNYTLDYNGRDQDFQSVGEARGSGNNTNYLTFSTGFELHRFFEGTGIILPLTYSSSVNTSEPRFTAGDDVVRSGELAEASESRANSRNFTARYSRTWSERSHPLLLYTLGGITANLAHSQNRNRSPVSVDTSTALTGAVNYSIAPRRLLEIPLPWLPAAKTPGATRPKLYPLPERFYWNYGIGTSRARSYDRVRDSLGTSVLRSRNATDGRTGSIDFGADSRPVDLLRHSIRATRNLTLRPDLREEIGFINLGRVVRWSQNLDSRYAVNRGIWLKPTVSWNSSYTQNNGPELSQDLSARSITNGQTLTATWDFPFDKLADVHPAPGDTTRRGTPTWRRWLSRVGAISTDASVNRLSGYTRVQGRPDFFYLTGLSRDPGLEADSTGRIVPLPGNVSNQGNDWRTGARARIALGLGTLVSTKLNYGSREVTVNNVTNKSNTLGFPDFDVDYGRVANVIGLGRFLTTPKLRTTYRHSEVTDFQNSAEPTVISTSSQWQPLIGLTGDFKNGTRAELKVDHRATERETRLLGKSISTDKNTDVSMNVSRSYTQGQKVSFLGRETTVRSSVSLRLSGAYSRRNGETVQIVNGVRRPAQFPVEEDRLSINAGGSYGFSDNVTGNVDLGFGQNRDLQRDIVRRNVRVEVRAQFTF